ncbi:hypothetical protein EV182_003381, partial [Spiromyces aspiralis]
RSSSELEVWNAPPNAGLCETFKRHTSTAKSIKYTPDGNIKIHSTDSYELVASIDRPNIVDTRFSPKGTYLMTWERFVKSNDGEPMHNNLCIWEVATGNLKAGFTQKAQSNWYLQWTSDEAYCARMVTNEIHFFETSALGSDSTPAMKLVHPGVVYFSISPGKSPAVGVFIPEKNGAPARVTIFYLGSFKTPVANKTFYRVDSVEMVWNNLGTNMLLIAHADVDKTNKSYYGVSRLYFLATSGNFDCAISLKKEGPIHDVAWSPVEKEFVVVYGYMPARTSLFNHRGAEIHDFGEAPRNYARFNPHGRVLLIGGFGNLSGDVDLWDRKDCKKVATFNENGASSCEWSPDGRYILAATLSPRLRVDNGIRVWHYSGALVYQREINELFQVQWRPAPVELFPQRTTLSPPPVCLAVKEKQAKATPAKQSSYVPPHLRNRNGGAASAVPGAPPSLPPGANPTQASKSALAKRKKKKSGNKQQRQQGGEDKPLAEAANGNVNGAETSIPTADPLKRVRNLEKKLTQIRKLKKKKEEGAELDEAQVKKLESEADVIKEIQQLSLEFKQQPQEIQ